jgi:putative PIN family toxin of toxin-antitoxin system
MTSEERLVLDTGVVVSAARLPRSVPRQAFDRAFARGTVLVSEATIDELNQVLRRRKFDRYVLEAERLEFLATFVRDITLVDVTAVVTVCRDPKDNKFLALAVSGNTTCIISGDDDLLVLHPFRGIPIITPRQFVSRFGSI